jgi:hypothetical protein
VISIINQHFEKDYKYYERICKRYFKGRYLSTDLLHEAYLCFINENEIKIKAYNDNNNLRILGIYYIRKLYNRRKQVFKNKNGHTSTLHELVSVENCLRKEDTKKDYDYVDVDANTDDFDFYQALEFERIEGDFESIDLIEVEKIKDEIITSVSNQDHDMNVFIMAQTQSINSISKETKINRASIQKSYDRAQIRLKRLVK